MAEDQNIENEGTVLLVDDEEAIRDALGELLETCGFEVLLADCYSAAVKVLEEHGGKIEAVIESDVHILDIAAVSLIVSEAGGVFRIAADSSQISVHFHDCQLATTILAYVLSFPCYTAAAQ